VGRRTEETLNKLISLAAADRPTPRIFLIHRPKSFLVSRTGTGQILHWGSWVLPVLSLLMSKKL